MTQPIRMTESIVRKARESGETIAAFFAEHAEMLERCVEALADRFERGGKLYAMGNGGSSCDAAHLVVELRHPIIEKRRALPAVALANDAALLTAIGNDTDFSRVFAEQLELEARPIDMAVGISTSGASTNVVSALRRARELDLLTVGFAGRDGSLLAECCHFCFVVPSWSTHRIQEAHTVLLHVLWDQLHVALGEDDVL